MTIPGPSSPILPTNPMGHTPGPEWTSLNPPGTSPWSNYLQALGFELGPEAPPPVPVAKGEGYQLDPRFGYDAQTVAMNAAIPAQDAVMFGAYEAEHGLSLFREPNALPEPDVQTPYNPYAEGAPSPFMAF